jgi:hypothetical protein
MQIPILREEEVNKEDPINMDLNLDRCVREEEKREEDDCALKDRANNNGGSKKDIRERIIDLIKSQGFSHVEGKEEFDDETSDLFAYGETLVEVVITTGIDEEVVKQMMK